MPIATLPEDVLIHVLSFHDHADTVEAVYVGRSFLEGVRRLLRLRPGQRVAFREACAECGRHTTFCPCEERSKRIAWFYFLFVFVLVWLSLLFPFMK
jgi:hypothetical protein